jgi:hypothetical protein
MRFTPAALLEQEHAVALLRETQCSDAAAKARSDNDVIVLLRLGHARTSK